jgi:hypothetical protein
MVNFCAVCGCCTRTDIVRKHLEDTLRICDVSAMGLYMMKYIDPVLGIDPVISNPTMRTGLDPRILINGPIPY